MNTVRFNKRATRVIAHRGLSGIEPENTNAAFIAAGNRSYYGIETDIHRTIDGHFVVSHDAHLCRTAGFDIDVESSTLAELQSVELLDKDGKRDRIDLRLTTLENYIKICKRYGKRAVLELKSDFSDEEISNITDIIDSYDYLDQTTFISFCYDNLLKIKNIRADAKAEFLFREFCDELLQKLAADNINIDIHHMTLTEQLIEQIHAAGLTVNCWTVDDPERAEMLSSWGIDYITSNILE